MGSGLLQCCRATHNGFIESFNGHFRVECLNAHRFSDILHAWKIINGWQQAGEMEKLKVNKPT
jgi:putative transposase